MLRITFLLGFLFFQTFAWSAAEWPMTRIQATATSKIYWTLYSDNGVAKIDVIEEKNSEAQQVIQSWGFSDFNKAERFYNSKTAGLAVFNEQLWTGETQTVKGQPNKRLWEAKNTWSWDWELKYAKWVADHVDKTFMQKYQIPSDCADLAYIVRWIFARENSLPVANKLSSTGKFMTHETVLKEWENLSTDPDWSKDKLFRTALRYLTRQTYTHILMRDSYPIAINSESVTEGVHHLQLREKSGHTMLVYKVDHSGGVPVRVLYSNVPIEVRELYESPFNDVSWPEADKRAFLRFRWPQKTSSGWSLVAATKMPFYSLEQFSEEITKEGPSFFVVAFKRISPNFSPLTLIEENLSSIFSQFENRVKIVEDGYKFCLTHDCAPGTTGDEDWSTPSRDQRIRDTFEALTQAINLYLEMTDDTLPQAVIDRMINYQLLVQGENFGFAPLYVSSMIQLMDSDPRVSIDERWAIKPTAIAKKLERTLEALFKVRDEKIKSAGSCSVSECPLGSAKWLEKSTAKEDKEISNVFLRLRIMCGVLKESCGEFNALFKQTTNFKEYFSKAITQHTSPSSPLPQRLGSANYRVQFVPDHSIPFAISENIFFQQPKIYRQASDDLFPEILCSEAMLNPKDASTVICVRRSGEVTEFEFLNRQSQVINRIQAPSKELMTQYWLANTNIFLLYFTNHIKIYSSQGQLIGETSLPEEHNIVGQRWLSTLDEEKYLKLLDLADIQKGWVRLQGRPLEELNNADAFAIADTGFFVVSEDKGLYVTNSAGEMTFSTNERLYQLTDEQQSLMTITTDDESKIYKLYQFENGVYKLVTEFKAPVNQIDWSFFKSANGYFYGNKTVGYTIYDLTTREHHYLAWTKDKVLGQFESDSIVLLDQMSPAMYGLYNLSGELILRSPYLMLQNDPLLKLKRLSFFVEQTFYNQTYREGQINTPLFSNTGFFYTPQDSDGALGGDWRLNPVPNSYVFGLAGGQIALHLLVRLGIELDYSSIMLTMPAN